MSEPTAEAAQAAPAVPTARFPLPAPAVPPITLRNELVKQGLAPATLKPQQAYAWVKSPGKNDPFPVKWYDAAGNVYDTQPAGDTAPLTRPGVTSLEDGIAWYQRKATAKPAPAPAAETASDVTEDESDEVEEEDGDIEDADFEEAE